MKNGIKGLTLIFAAVMTVLSLWLLGACGTDGMENVSERRSGYYSADGVGGAVAAASGVRETPYTIDGAAAALKPYTLITFTPVKFDADAVYTYRATTSAGSYGGTLVAHPFAASFSAEFDSETTDGEFTISITTGGKTEEYVLKSLITEDMFGYDKAIDAARKELDPPEPYEIRVRVIKNPLGDGLCWHVSYYSADGAVCGVLLDPVTAKIIAKKTV